ncbi:MAG: hypothetical protein DRN96_06025 [Thermoproteota archaeon]|nr:MAG: hypothetical protein DRN96_06025 [Candidatus Korarchaeota archaeon]RLG54790.1 MAG: hypothetical protein DRN99_04510 [Candidatus Korarchaeota archaeon]
MSLTQAARAIKRARDLAEAIGCVLEEVAPEELLAYISGPTYEEDKISAEEILSSELLTLHELAEISELKRAGFKISQSTVIEAYPRAYEAHLKAMEVELRAAMAIGDTEWVQRRLRDLRSYLEDERLPDGLKPRVAEIISKLAEALG